ncbi:MAG: hypothetical protein ACYCWW_11985 [Deltaproteobacteria bacterium]
MAGFDNHYRIVLLAALGLSLPARADFKSFAHVYPYFTQPEGGKEVEIWNGLEVGDLSHPGATNLIDELAEIEYGLTDHWDLSLYWELQQAPGGPLAIDGYQLESRYRFGEKGLYPIDVELYGEIERPADLAMPFEAEAKLILEKDIGHFFFQGNLIDAEELAGGAAFGYRLAFNGGAGYELRPGIHLGAELLLNDAVNGLALGGGFDRSVRLGPSLSLATSRFWFVITPAFLVAGQSSIEEYGSAMRLRFIVGIPLD